MDIFIIFIIIIWSFIILFILFWATEAVSSGKMGTLQERHNEDTHEEELLIFQILETVMTVIPCKSK